MVGEVGGGGWGGGGGRKKKGGGGGGWGGRDSHYSTVQYSQQAGGRVTYRLFRGKHYYRVFQLYCSLKIPTFHIKI